MTSGHEPYTWKDRFAEFTSRPYRLALWAVLFGLTFVLGRFFFLFATLLFAFVRGARTYKTGGGKLILFAAFVLIAFLSLHLDAFYQSKKIEKFLNEHSSINLSRIPNGTYNGTGSGNNGDLRISVDIKDGQIENLNLLSSREPVYAFDDVIESLKGKSILDLTRSYGFVFRNKESISGISAALENALLSQLPDYPSLNRVSRATFFLSANRLGRIFINTLAILFIAIITFDFFLQPALAKGTGQSLNCYNCQACVGVCPVKMVAGDPFPMIMVIEARAGNYEKVAALAKYCVGCGKCAAKCPVGNSGPSVAGSSYLLWKQEIQREKKKEEAQLRGWPTLDKLSEEPKDE